MPLACDAPGLAEAGYSGFLAKCTRHFKGRAVAGHCDAGRRKPCFLGGYFRANHPKSVLSSCHSGLIRTALVDCFSL